jgi:large subunit ribosomal protein L13
MTKSYLAKPGEVTPQWHLVNAEGQILGRLASRIATILMGKHRPTYTRHIDTGDYVVVVNAEKVKVTGRKADQKLYYRATTYPGSLRSHTYREVMQAHPDRIIGEAVRRMLPKSNLAKKMFLKLKVYTGPEHPHVAQNPQPLAL